MRKQIIYTLLLFYDNLKLLKKKKKKREKGKLKMLLIDIRR